MAGTDKQVLSEDQYGGPHPWQTNPLARLARKMLRHREYTRWAEQYCAPLSVFGLENLKDIDGPAIFVPNHQSHMDTPVVMTALPGRLQDNFYFGAAADRWFVKGKKKLILQPWYQSLALGNFPIVRGGGTKTLDYARSLLSKGARVCIFPEGTRATSSELGQFRHGVSILAKSQGVPVVPVVLKGLREMRPKGAQTVTPGPASVTFLEPVQIPIDMEIAAATQMLWERMNSEFARPRQLPVAATLADFERAA